MLSMVITLGLALAFVQGQKIEPIVINVPEELDIGVEICDLKQDAGLNQLYEEETLKMLQFDFSLPPSRETPRYQDYYKVDHHTGYVLTAKRIDREEICPFNVTCTMKLDIVVQPFDYFRIIKLQVNILDINDHSPNFPNPSFSVSIPESSAIGDTFPIPSPIDPDSPRNGVYNVEAVTCKDTFGIEVRHYGGKMKVLLVLKARLYMSVQDKYTVRAKAIDNGLPPREGYLTINVEVTKLSNIGGSLLVFENSTYMVKVRENIPTGSVLLRVHAMDPSSKTPQETQYGFSNFTVTAYGNIFGINSINGEIYLKRQLDYEESREYHLTVTAKDLRVGSMVMDAAVNIYVLDVNDNAPRIRVHTFTSNGMALVTEWTRVGYFVAHVAISDEDNGINGKFTCEVSDSQFRLENDGGENKLLTAGTFDREVKDRYDVMLTCRDMGSPQLTSSVNIHVLVLDENDNYPEFVYTPYKAELLENNQIGADIIHISASDPDLNDNGFVLYKLAGDQSHMFEITKTGIVLAKTTFDYEEIDHVFFEVVAYDQGIPSRSVSTSVLVKVVNVNDEAPVFAQTTYHFTVPENEPVNTFVGRVAASDADDMPFNQFHFALGDCQGHCVYGTSHTNENFYVDPVSGIISTRRMLDREKQSVYYLEVLAIDKGGASLTGSVSVTVHVGDKNDNIPVIDFPSFNNRSVVVPADILAGHEVTQILAHDDDQNSKLSFYITEQTPDEIFTIDPWTGVITTVKTLSFMGKTKSIKLHIQVEDNAHRVQNSIRHSTSHSVDTTLKIIFDKSVPFMGVVPHVVAHEVAPPQGPTSDHVGGGNTFSLILFSALSMTVLLLLIVFLVVASSIRGFWENLLRHCVKGHPFNTKTTDR